MSIAAAIVLAAGQGTRMKSKTAKVLHFIGGQPMIYFPVELVRKLGAGRAVVVIGHQHEAVRAVLAGRFGTTVETALQLEQRGTAHAVQQALPLLEGVRGAVLVLYGDVPLLSEATLRRLIDAYPEGGLALVTAKPPVAQGYGRIVRDGSGAVVRIVEEKDASAEEKRIGEINAGIYCVDAELLRTALSEVGSNNAQREFYLTDLAERAAQKGRVASVDADPEEVAGINDRAQLVSCEKALRRRMAQELMRAGVTLRDPERTVLEVGVNVGADTEIGPNCELRGRTYIGEGCKIEAGCIITDTEIGPRVHIKPYSVLSESRVGAGAILGPFAHLRPGTELAEEVHIGNFVETKKARLGAGAKANHLSYLGDTEIGARVNVGAGTITCNYDGVHKHRTIIEEDAFIGSDTQLVAPVKVGAGAYIGAGTTVTRDVPAGALALTRAPQKIVEGYAEKKRRRKE